VKHLLHPEADEEFAGAVRYYSQISPELGVRFYREMERLFREVCAGVGKWTTRLRDYRTTRLADRNPKGLVVL